MINILVHLDVYGSQSKQYPHSFKILESSRILYSARVMSNKLSTAAWKGPEARWAMGDGRWATGDGQSHGCASVEENPAPWFQHGGVLYQ